MSLGEFSLIDRFWQRPPRRTETRLGIGDDCALLKLAADQELVITADTLVSGVHFLADVPPLFLGYKMLAVNLSDLAAMGAEPVAVTLALTLPELDEAWLADLAKGFWRLADDYQLDLIGGDTTQGPLTLTLQAMGKLPQGQALTRSGAQVGDGIYVSGNIGDAGLGLKMALGQIAQVSDVALDRYHQPQPRVASGLALRGLATACIDVSDGLAQDLSHILKQSGVGATLVYEHVPASPAVLDYLRHTGDGLMPLTAGDDYELCCTVPDSQAFRLPENFTRIGTIEAQPGLRLQRHGLLESLDLKGYEHFSPH